MGEARRSRGRGIAARAEVVGDSRTPGLCAIWRRFLRQDVGRPVVHDACLGFQARMRGVWREHDEAVLPEAEYGDGVDEVSVAGYEDNRCRSLGIDGVGHHIDCNGMSMAVCGVRVKYTHLSSSCRRHLYRRCVGSQSKTLHRAGAQNAARSSWETTALATPCRL